VNVSNVAPAATVPVTTTGMDSAVLTVLTVSEANDTDNCTPESASLFVINPVPPRTTLKRLIINILKKTDKRVPLDDFMNRTGGQQGETGKTIVDDRIGLVPLIPNIQQV
jgi:hypothetical protein